MKVRDIVGLYTNPPDHAVVVCVHEKPQIQALDRTQRILPMEPGQAERQSRDYIRHEITSLFAALEIKTGRVLGQPHLRHRAVEFRKFMDGLDAACSVASLPLSRPSASTSRPTTKPPGRSSGSNPLTKSLRASPALPRGPRLVQDTTSNRPQAHAPSSVSTPGRARHCLPFPRLGSAVPPGVPDPELVNAPETGAVRN